MRVQLDHEQWEVADDATILQVLAEVSDRAQAQQRVVTSLCFNDRRLTDRDLQPALFARTASEAGPIRATSQPMEDIVAGVEPQLRRFAVLIREQGQALIDPLRTSTAPVQSIDAWLGLLADYVEAIEVRLSCKHSDIGSSLVSPWIGPLLDAREAGDVVRLADILEYELLPCLPEQA
ncbi:MAG TPA: hypothetical protein VJ692_05060 [Nitrospiraceae bacterium]|nr:hypothetical protein [Nitrospiraceae bacterium]